MPIHLKREGQEIRVSEKVKWENVESYLLFLRHKKAYKFASEYCKNKYVLDYGCGSGYGSFMLSKYANQVIGVDIDEKVINLCIKKYKSSNLIFKKIGIYPLSFENKFFDVIVSFQVIEHILDIQKYLYELRRILKDDGKLLITTPNRKYRLLPFQRPWNPEHITEYSLLNLKKQLLTTFKKVQIIGIYGTKEINEIEHKRVKKDKNPFLAYIYYPGRCILTRVLPDSVFSNLKKLERKVFFKNIKSKNSSLDLKLIKEYNLNDFIIGDNDENISLDYLAICQKY